MALDTNATIVETGTDGSGGSWVMYDNGWQICTKTATITTTGNGFADIVFTAVPKVFLPGTVPAGSWALNGGNGATAVGSLSVVQAFVTAAMSSSSTGWWVRSTDATKLLAGATVIFTMVGRWK